MHAIKLATLNPARYFGLRDLGLVAPGYDASLAILDDLEQCRVWRTYHGGRLVAAEGKPLDPDADRRKRCRRRTGRTGRVGCT